MAVSKRKNADGTYSENYYFRFKFNGQTYRGSTFTSVESEAKKYEAGLKNKLKGLNNEEDSNKVKKKSLLNFREKVTAQIAGNSVPLDKVWEKFKAEAPARMRRIPNEKGWSAKEGYWQDFYQFLKEKHPECVNLRDVKPEMAQEYISLLKTTGRYRKNVSYNDISYKNKITQLSPGTISEYITQIKQIFTFLADAAGILEDPFRNIAKPINKKIKREVFDIQDLKKIVSYIEELQERPPRNKDSKLDFLVNEAIFIIGFNTGLRRNDISLLKWSDINFNKKSIETIIHKTKEKVFVPMTKPLYEFLQKKYKRRVNEYVTPELAALFKGNQGGVSYRFKKMLKTLDIQSNKLHEGRSRQTSNKDIHSLRHTFCYIHGLQGTPMALLQSMVGHMDSSMTEAYMMHKTEEMKRQAIERFALKPLEVTPQLSTYGLTEDQKEAIELIKSCQDNNSVKQIIEHLQSYGHLRKI